MPRSKSPFGPNLKRVLEHAPPSLVTEFLASHQRAEEELLQPPVCNPATQEEPARKALSEFLAALDQDVLAELDRVCVGILEMSEGKGATSLETVVAQKLYNVEIAEFEDRPDPLCRSLWVHTRCRGVFHDAESFYAARRYREHKQLYAAFEVDLGDEVKVGSDQFDTDRLCRKLEEKLELKSRASASILNLPKTEGYPSSLMIALRHPGALSSIQDHRDDGGWRTYYYRPSNEAVLIYTPKLRQIEVCAESFEVRKEVAELFAEVALGQNLSEKPLTRRNFNLERFRETFRLDIPEFDDVEVTDARVVEAEMPLGTWARRLNLKVSRDDDIEAVLSSHLQDASRKVRRFGFCKITITVGYVRRADGKKGTLRLTVSSGNTSNVQSFRDPFLRELGFRLLAFWGLQEKMRTLTESEKARWFTFLLALYDQPEGEVAGSFMTAAGVDPKLLVDAAILSRKSRQAVVLMDDDDEVIESEVETGPTLGTVRVRAGFGEQRGSKPDANLLIYKLDRGWLAEVILKSVSDALDTKDIQIVNDHLVSLGRVPIQGLARRVYLARQLDDAKVIGGLDLELRRRSKGGPGIVLSVSESSPKYLGPNVVVPLRSILSSDPDAVGLSTEALADEFQAGQSLVAAAQVAQVLRHGAHAGTLILPGEDPLSLTTANQVSFFERLVEATQGGAGQLMTKALMEGFGSDHPRQLFTGKAWDLINGTYIEHGSSNRFWRLVPYVAPAHLEFG